MVGPVDPRSRLDAERAGLIFLDPENPEALAAVRGQKRLCADRVEISRVILRAERPVPAIAVGLL